MRQRILELTGVAAVITVVSLASVAGQIRGDAPKAAPGPAPKTSWGDADLQGIWDVVPYQVPLQRPAKYKDQEFFTDAQIKELDTIRAAMPGNETRATRGTDQDVAGAYNAVYGRRSPTGRRTSLIVDPPDGRIPPVTAAVAQRRKEISEYNIALLESADYCKPKADGKQLPGCEGVTYTGKVNPLRNQQPKWYSQGRLNRMDGIEDHGIGTRCMGGTLPDFGGYRQIVQSPGAVSIFYDTGQGQGWQRAVPITSNPHLPANVRQSWGDSRARWEGNTLVVDVTNFDGKHDINGSLENLHLIERWTRTGPDTLELVTTLEDPTSWTKPWTVKQEFAKQEDQFNRIWKEPRCQEGNYGSLAMLAGARAMEQAFAEGRGPDPSKATNYATPTGAANALALENGEEDADPLQ